MCFYHCKYTGRYRLKLIWNYLINIVKMRGVLSLNCEVEDTGMHVSHQRSWSTHVRYVWIGIVYLNHLRHGLLLFLKFVLRSSSVLYAHVNAHGTNYHSPRQQAHKQSLCFLRHWMWCDRLRITTFLWSWMTQFLLHTKLKHWLSTCTFTKRVWSLIHPCLWMWKQMVEDLISNVPCRFDWPE